jgi:GNAT superfamily N-acetyltransferase
LTVGASAAMLDALMGIEIRAVSGHAELERWVAARNEVLPDDTDTVAMKALLRASQDDRLDLIAYRDGEVAGTGLLAGDPHTLAKSHPYVEVTVPERHRGHGVGSALLRTLSDRLRELGKDGLEVEARADDAYSLAYLERRGFAEVDRWMKLVLELDRVEVGRDTTTAEDVGIAWLTDRPELVEGLYEVAAAARRDRTGSVHAWQVYELGDPRIRLDLTAVAVAEEQVVGYSTFLHLVDERGGWLRALIVHPSRNEHVVGAALTEAQIAEARAAGIDSLLAWVRPGPQQRLYASLGFEEQGASIDFRGPLL